VGITRIKEEGGVTLVQQPQEAEFDGMPRAAIATGTADWVLPAAQMPAKLLELWANARVMELPGAAELGLRVDVPASAEATQEAEEALREALGLAAEVRVLPAGTVPRVENGTAVRVVAWEAGDTPVPGLH